jgi:hypothetical protein
MAAGLVSNRGQGLWLRRRDGAPEAGAAALDVAAARAALVGTGGGEDCAIAAWRGVRRGVEALQGRLLGPAGPNLGYAGYAPGCGRTCSSSSRVLVGAHRSFGHCGSQALERRLRTVVRSV